MKIDFCLPIKNEGPVLQTSILKLYSYLKSQNFEYSWNIVILVNGSKDKSSDIANNLAVNYQCIKVRFLEKSGKGFALKSYFKESKSDILVFMDIDLATDLNNIPDLITPITKDNYDLVVGSRFLSDSKLVRSRFNILRSKAYILISKFFISHKSSDLQCGFKAFKNGLFKNISPLLKDDQWFFDTELIILTSNLNYKIKEIPVDWQENRFFSRKSKVRNKEILTFIKRLFQLRRKLKDITNRKI